MSSAPEVAVLSKKQQSKTLSAKKKSLKSIRNVLSSSRTINWPLLETDDKMKILNEFSKIQINNFKEEKRKSTKNTEKSLSGPTIVDVRKSIKFGINEIAKHLRTDDCSGVLVEANIPHILVAHIISVAESKNIPVFCIPGLKDVLESIFHFKSSTICFKKNCHNEIFREILDAMNESKPKDVKPDKTSECSQLISKMETDISLDSKPLIKTEIIYLHRTNRKERVFTPQSSATSIDIPSKKGSETLSYIKLRVNTDRQNKSKASFKPLVINRIKNNVNRSKENQLKQKKKNKT